MAGSPDLIPILGMLISVKAIFGMVLCDLLLMALLPE